MRLAHYVHDAPGYSGLTCDVRSLLRYSRAGSELQELPRVVWRLDVHSRVPGAAQVVISAGVISRRIWLGLAWKRARTTEPRHADGEADAVQALWEW